MRNICIVYSFQRLQTFTYRFLCKSKFSVLLGKYGCLRTFGPMLTVFNFIKNWHTVFKVASSFCMTTRNEPEWLVFGMGRLSYISHSNRSAVIAFCGLYLYFPNKLCCWPYSYMFICHLYISFGDISVQIHCPFFIIFFSYWILCSLYNLKRTPLLDTYLQIFFSQSVVCLCIFLALYLQDKILIL